MPALQVEGTQGHRELVHMEVGGPPLQIPSPSGEASPSWGESTLWQHETLFCLYSVPETQ